MDHRPELADKAERASRRRGMAVEALHRTREAHLRAIEVHERAAALFEQSGEAERAAAEREAVEREWRRLREAEQLIAEHEATPLPPGEPGPGRTALAGAPATAGARRTWRSAPARPRPRPPGQW